jgi:RNA polymerase sigma factor (sigma-70 family)
MPQCQIPPPSPKTESPSRRKVDKRQRPDIRSIAERNRLVTENQGLAGMGAKIYGRSVADFDERLSIANMGLLRAARRFDPTRGFKFSTFALRCIQSSFRREWTRGQSGRAKIARNTISIFSGEENSSHGDVFGLVAPPDSNGPTADFRRAMKKVLSRLTEPERFVLRARFFEGLTLEECGRARGLSNERIRQIEKQALISAREIISGSAELTEELVA